MTIPTPPGRQEERPNRPPRTVSQAGLALEPAWWRLALHLTLAFGATPLPGAALAAARMLRQTASRRLARRQIVLAFVLLAQAGAATTTGIAVSLLAPVSVPVTAALIGTAWCGAGSLTWFLERQAGVVPATAPAPWAPRAVAIEALTWALALPVGALPVAVLGSAVASRWQDELFDKPTLPRAVLLFALLWLAPLGAAVGLGRALLRRQRRLAPPLATAVSLPAVLLLLFLALGFCQIGWTFEADVSAWWLAPARLAPLLWAGAAGLLALTLFLSEARGTFNFLRRWLQAALIVAGFCCAVELMAGPGPGALHRRLAERSEAAARHRQAAQQWRWLVARGPRLPWTADVALRGAREALLAGDRPLARSLLRRIDAALGAEYAARSQVELARALLASGLDLRGVRQVSVVPVRLSGDAFAGWNALLTAVRAARPELAPGDLRRQLDEASLLPSSPPSLPPLARLRLVAELFGCEALAVPYEQRGALLDAAVPVLVRPGLSDAWQLLHWQAPGADAVILIDDTSAEVLRSDSTYATMLSREDGLAFALLRRGDPRRAGPLRSLAPLPVWRLALASARSAIDHQAFRRGLAQAASLPPGSWRRELLAAAWLDRAGRQALSREPRSEAQSAAAALLSAEGLERASPWALDWLGSWSLLDGPESCRRRTAILSAWAAYFGESAPMLRPLMRAAAREGDAELAARAALDLARSQAWKSREILAGLDTLATIATGAAMGRGPGEPPAEPLVRHTLAILLAHLGPLVHDERSLHTVQANLAPCCAARAVLATSRRERVRWWRRATALTPSRADYWLALADALERDHQPAAAAAALRRAVETADAPDCVSYPPAQAARTIVARGGG